MTDWLMVIITGVYVFATIKIMKANQKSAEEAQAQLNLMKKQFDEENRPRIEVEMDYCHQAWYILRFVNVGKLTAQRVQIHFDGSFIDSVQPKIKDLLLRENEKECVIGVGKSHQLIIGDNDLRNIQVTEAKGVVQYEANGKTYTDEFCIDIQNYMTIYSFSEKENPIVGAIKKNTEAIEKLQKNNI